MRVWRHPVLFTFAVGATLGLGAAATLMFTVGHIGVLTSHHLLMLWPTSILGTGFLHGPRIDGMLRAAGWILQDRVDANIDAGPGVAIREFSLGCGYGEADYLLFVDGQAAGVIEAKKEGSTIVSVEIQTQKYSEGIPDGVPAPRRLRTRLI